MTNHQTPQPAKMPASVGERFAEAIGPMDLSVEAAVAIADAIHEPVERFLIGEASDQSTFTASNGYRIVSANENEPATWVRVHNRNADPNASLCHSLGLYTLEALREFFESEREGSK